MSFFHFHHIELLWGLLVIPLLIAIFIAGRYLSAKNILKFGDMELVKRLMPDVSIFRPIFKFSLAIIALIFIILSMADKPEIAQEEKDKKGVEINIALDISNSMKATDIPMGRLEAAKLVINKLIDRLEPNNYIGMLVFAGVSRIETPITHNFSNAQDVINSIHPGMITTQGTAIGDVISKAMKSYTPNSESNKVLIIITDGEDHQQDAIQQAKIAAENNIIIHTIGMGLPKGGPIPENKFGKKDFKRDENGNVIVTKLNQQMLIDIATAGNGKYFSYANINEIFNEIEKLDKTDLSAQEQTGESPEEIIEKAAAAKTFYFKERFLWFAGIALFFLLFEIVIIERKNKLFKNFNLFKFKI